MHRTFFTRVAVLILIAVALYTGAGFLLAPRLLQTWIEAALGEHSDQRLRIREVTFNPFTFGLVLTDTTLQDSNDDRLLSIPVVSARADLTSVFAGALVFRDADMRDARISSPADGDIVAVPRLHAASIAVDMSNYSTFVDNLRFEGSEFRLERKAAGGLNLPGWLVRLAIDPAAAMITLGRAEIVGARASFTDRQIVPPVRLEADAINGGILRQGAGSATTVDVDLKGRLVDAGFVTLVTRLRASDPHNPANVKLTLTDFDLTAISPYFREVTGHGVSAGRLDLDFGYQRDDSSLETQGRVSINELRLDEPADSATREAWPLEIAVALLEDSNGYIGITLPARSMPAEAGPTVAALLTSRLRGLVLAMTANPLEEMAVIAGLPDEPLNRVSFQAGSAETAPTAAARMTALSAALAARPRLGLRIYPAYDPVVDRLALAARQLRLHVALATSEGPPGQAVEKPIDFNHSRVRGILDEFSAARLSPSLRATISRDHSDQDENFYRAVFAALVENEKVPVTALERLAGYRAQSFINALKTNGVSAARLLRSELVELTDANHEAIELRVEAMALHDKK